MKNKQKEIKFTDKQFLSLLKIVYLGNWMANATRTGRPGDTHIQEYEDMEDYIFSFAKQFGYSQYVDEGNLDEGKYYPTRDFEENENVREIIEEYDNETFWEELSDKLGRRDFYRKYSPEEITNMTQKERFIKLCECIDKWEDEIDANDLETLTTEH